MVGLQLHGIPEWAAPAGARPSRGSWPPTRANFQTSGYSTAAQRGEVIVSSGAAAANSLGLTTQVPVRSVYLTSGRTRKMSLGKQIIELRHAPRWQLTMPHRLAGQAVRALAWLGPERAESALQSLKRKLPPAAFSELVAAAPQFPTWLARSVGKVAHG